METKKNNLPTSWAVINDGSDLFMEIVLKYLNNGTGLYLNGKCNTMYYGINTNGKFEVSSNANIYNNKILTITEFDKLHNPVEEWIPKYGDLVEVSNNKVVWGKSKYIAKIDNLDYPHLVTDEFNKLDARVNTTVQACKYIRSVNSTFEITSDEVFELISSAKGVDKNNIKIVN